MRMWCVDPAKMCKKHLLGEHVEMHMFVGSLRKGINLSSYMDSGKANLLNLFDRHEEIVQEMLMRGMNHESPIISQEEIDRILLIQYPTRTAFGRVVASESERELYSRCQDCLFSGF